VADTAPDTTPPAATRAAAVAPTLVERFVASVEANGFRVHRGALPDIPGAGVSVALYGLVDSGSVVLSSAPAEPRANSLLPDVHVTVLVEDRILLSLPDLFAALGNGLPSSLAIVSGPSKSADIEQLLAVGVHGPKEEHIVLLPPGGDLGDVVTGLTADDFRRPVVAPAGPAAPAAGVGA